jgi:peptidoglycan/LPS O-acetylase OafA/YrhL
MTQEKITGRIRELDGWRALSASMVLIGHFLGYQHTQKISHYPLLVSTVFHMSFLGVQIFFVISGFVICRLLLREESRHGAFSLKAFYVRRVCRIVPPFYLYLATVSLLGWLGLLEITGTQVAKAGFFLADFRSLSASWITGHSWSLAVEEQFYLFFPPALWLTPRRWRAAVGSGICVVCIASILLISFTKWNATVSAGVMEGFLCISCGVMTALHEDKVRAVARKIPAFVVLLLAAMLMLHTFADLNEWKAALYQVLAVPPAIVLVLFFTVEQQSWLRSVLLTRPIQGIGLTSYALYLWQQLFMGRPEVYFGAGHFIPLLSPLLCVIVPLSWFLIEKPAMRLGASLSRRLRQKQDALSAIA